MIGEPPKSVPTTRRQKVTPNLEVFSAVRGSNLDVEIVPVLQQKILLKGLYPPPTRTIGSHLIKIHP
jgi:hypothetical protein